MKMIWSFTKWCGRVSLWFLITPVGIWRSVRHGRQKRHDELIQTLKERQA